MKYKKIYKNQHFKIEVNTDMKVFFDLIDGFLDFDNRSALYKRGQVFNIKYIIRSRPKSIAEGKTLFTYEGILTEGKNLSCKLDLANVKINCNKDTVTADVMNFVETCKERLLDLVFFKPLYVIVASYYWLFLHAAIAQRGDDTILIIGGQRAGKTSIALALGKKGYNILSDDDCFVKLSNGKVEAIPFPTKVGLDSKNLKKYPKLGKHAVKNFMYGNKKRVSLKHVCPQKILGKKPYHCKAVFFPEYCPDKKSGIRKIRKQGTLKGFLANSYENFEGKFWMFNDIARKVAGYKLYYNDAGLKNIGSVIEDVFKVKRNPS